MSTTPPATPAAPAAADNAVHRACDALAAIAVGVAGCALVGLVVVQGWQVVARYMLNNSPSWTEPVTLLLLATAMSLGAAAGVHERRHFGFYLLAEALPPAGRRIASGVVSVVIICIGVVIAAWGVALLRDGIDIRMAGAALPQSLVYLPLSLGGALMALFAANGLWAVLHPTPTPAPTAAGAT